MCALVTDGNNWPSVSRATVVVLPSAVKEGLKRHKTRDQGRNRRNDEASESLEERQSDCLKLSKTGGSQSASAEQREKRSEPSTESTESNQSPTISNPSFPFRLILERATYQISRPICK
jgi:hypothetical protein